MKKWIFISLIFAYACSDVYVVPEDHYIIPAGAHESRLVSGSLLDKERSLKQDKVVFSARFDESAIYDLKNEDQDDINKLFGFSEANSFHHDNSARFGWRYSIEKDRIEIFSYVYSDGIRSYQHITDVAIDETVAYSIHIYPDSYIFSVKDVTSEVERNIDQDRGLYYLLFPYFGGDQVAPHDIHIYIKEEF